MLGEGVLNRLRLEVDGDSDQNFGLVDKHEVGRVEEEQVEKVEKGKEEKEGVVERGEEEEEEEVERGEEEVERGEEEEEEERSEKAVEERWLAPAGMESRPWWIMLKLWPIFSIFCACLFCFSWQARNCCTVNMHTIFVCTYLYLGSCSIVGGVGVLVEHWPCLHPGDHGYVDVHTCTSTCIIMYN